MTVDLNVFPYYDDYFAENGGLSKNYYQVLFRPGRALQARELTTAQTILQNQVGSLGKHFFPDGDDVYGANRSLLNPLAYVKLANTLSDGNTIPVGASGDTFTNIAVGDVLKDTTYNIKAKVVALCTAEGGDPHTLWVKYQTSNGSVEIWPNATSIVVANTDVEVAKTLSASATGLGHGVTVGDGIIFTKNLFVQAYSDVIILSKYTTDYNSRIGYAVSDKFITSTEDSLLNDNAQGYPNFTAAGADRLQVNLTLCNIGYEADWINNDVNEWSSGVRYNKNRKIKISGSSEVYICIKSHVSTSVNKPDNIILGQNNPANLYWVSVKDFVEIDRTQNGTWIGSISSSPSSSATIGFSESTFNTIMNVFYQREAETNGNYNIVPHNITVEENFINGIKLANNSVTVANNDQMLITIDSGKSVVNGKDIITQLPERFLIDKARSNSHVTLTQNYTPEINYGNYILVKNVSGYFDIDSNETVTFYSKTTDQSNWDDEANKVATANIRYFMFDSGDYAANSSNGLNETKYRAYLYNFTGIKPGESRAMKSAHGQADGDVTITTYTQTVGGEVNTKTANVYSKLYESGKDASVFPLMPGFIRQVGDVNTANTPVVYTTKTFNCKLVKTTQDSVSVYQLYTSSGSLITQDYIGAILGNGLINPANEVDVANANYTIVNKSGTTIALENCGVTTHITDGELIPASYICGQTHSNFKWTSDATPYLLYYFPTSSSTTTVTNIILRVKVGLLSLNSDKKYYRPNVYKTVLYPETSTTQGFDSKSINFFESDINTISAVYMSDTTSKQYVSSGSANTTVKLSNVTGLSAGMLLYGNGFSQRQYIISANTSTSTITVSDDPDSTPTDGGFIEFINAAPALPSIQIDIDTTSGYPGTAFLVGETIYEVSSTTNLPTTVTGTIVESNGSNTYTFLVGVGSDNNQYFTANNIVVGTHSKTVGRVRARNIRDGVRDITTRYNFKTGQTYSLYDWSSLNLKTGAPAPTGSLIIVYNKFETEYSKANTKSFYTASSYGYYANNDFYGYSSNTDIALDFDSLPITSDTIDFRPQRKANTSVSDLSTGTTAEINDYSNIFDPVVSIINPSPSVEDKFKIDYEYFVGRNDLVVLNKDTQFEIVSGIPGKSFPSEPQGAMTIWKLSIPPYTDKVTDVKKEAVSNKVYTMKDIASLEERIKSLEQFAKVTDDELTALTKPQLSMSAIYKGLERFKNGVLLDTFTDFSKADVTSSDFKCSIDNSLQTLRAPFDSIAIDIDQDSSHINTAYHKVNSKDYINSDGNSSSHNNGVVTMAYTHDKYIAQGAMTTAISVNPYNVTSFIGTLKLDPPSDSWMETTVLPAVTVQDPSNAAAEGLEKSVNERLEVSIKNVSGTFTIGAAISTNTGGSGVISDISPDNSVLTIIHHEGKWNDIIDPETGLDPIISSSGVSATIDKIVARGGIAGFGTSFGDWKTTWVGSYKEVGKQTIGAYSETSQVSAIPSGTRFVSADASGINVQTGYETGYWRHHDKRANEWVSYWQPTGNQKVTTDVWKRMTDPNVPSWWNGDPSTAAYVLNVHGGTVQETRTYTTSKVTKNATSRDTKTGSRNDLVLKTVNTSEGQKVVDVATIPYMRSKNVIFDVKGLKPNTIVVPYFDSINVSMYCNQRTGTSTPWTFSSSNVLKSDRRGVVQGRFSIPQGVFKTGERKFRLISITVPEDSIEKAGTFAEAMYTASGTKQNIQETIISTKVPEIVQKTLTTERVSTSITTENVTDITYSYGDPLAETFLVDSASSPEGVYLTALDLFVANTPLSSLPLWIEIRNVSDGYPTQIVIPGTKIIYNYDDDLKFTGSSTGTWHNGTDTLTVKTIEDHVLISGQYITFMNDEATTTGGRTYNNIYQISEVVDSKTFKVLIAWADVDSRQPNTAMTFSKINIAETPNWTPTRFNFEHPIYLQPGEYAFVIQSNDDAYEVYMAEMGGKDLITEETISRQPYTGSMFKSQNASTWTATQESDIAFNIWRAKFSTGTGSVIFGQNDTTLVNLPGQGVILSPGFNIKYSLLNFNTNVINTRSTNITWFTKSMDLSGALSDWETMTPSQDEIFTTPRMVEEGSSSVQIKAVLTTSSNMVSPLIDMTDQRAILIENIINNNVENEHIPSGGSAQAKYVSKSVVLEEGMDASDIQVNMKASRLRQGNDTSEIRVYAKLQSSSDNETSFDKRSWYPLVLSQDPGYSKSAVDYMSYSYVLPKNIWFIDEGDGNITIYRTGDGRVFDGATIEYNEDELSIFADLGVKIIEHVSYDVDTESLTYTYYDGQYPDQEAYASFDSFKQYAIKIAMLSSNSAMIPIINEYQALALT